ncbi:WASH complex subunit 2A isoform X3 [Pogona vitticeps]
MSSAASSSGSDAEAPSGVEEAAAAAAAAAAALLLWERAWSLEEVRAGSQGWSLAADAGLLRFLQEFSQQTLARTHEIKKQMDRLVHETKTTDCRLHNVFSGFLMLSNTQFIENRVYDDEVEEPIPRNEAGDKLEQEKTREQKEADLIPKIQEAVNYGLQVLDSAFEQLDIKAGNSDSEEETTERVELILEPKDLYIDRPLPYLIGSHLFMEQDDVGLGDLSSEEGSIGSDRGSMIESEGKDEEKTVLISDEEDYLFGDSEKGEEEEEEEEEEGDLEVNAKPKKKRPTSFTDELAARITKDVLDGKSKMTVTEKEEVNVSSDDDDIFKPPKLTDEDFLPFASKGGLFSGGKGLFDDEESDLFAEAPKGEDLLEKETRIPINDEPSSKAMRKVPAGAVSLFPGRNDVFSPSFITEKENKEPIEPIADKVSKLHENSGLFGGDDDDHFKSNKESSIPAKPATDLFDAEGDLFKESPDVTSVTNEAVKEARGKKELITGDKSQPDSAEIFKPLTQTSSKGQISLFSDEEDSEQDLLFSDQSSKGNKSSSSNKVTTKPQVSLFEDEDEEDLFGPLPKTQVSKPPQEKATGVLFSSDEEDHWNITKEVKPASECSQTKKTVHAAAAVSHNIKKCLFEEKEEDLFTITKESPRKPQKAALLFDDEEVNGDTLFKFQPSHLPSVDFLDTPQKKLVEEKADSLNEPGILRGSNLGGGDVVEQQKKEEAPLDKNNRRKIKSVFSLFDEEEKNEDMDVNKNTQKEKSPVGSVRSKSTGVFQDEELLFSRKLQKDNDPDVDLFAHDKKEDPKPRVKSLSEQGLFGADDDGDDNLFSSSKAKSLVVEKETIKKASTISSFKEDNKISENHQKVKREDDSRLEATEKLKPCLLYPKTPAYEPHGIPHTKIACVAGSSEEMGVSFDYPLQVNTLQNANKGRIKMTGKRRPPTRAARRLAAQDSSKNEMNIPDSLSLPLSTEGSSQQNVLYPYKNERHRKENTEKAKLFVSASSKDQLHVRTSPVLKSTAQLDTDDLFESNDLFASNVSHKVSSRSKTTVETGSHVSQIPIDSGQLSASSSLDGANCEDLFQPAKLSKKSSSTSLLKDKEDLFTTSKTMKRKDPKPPTQSEQNPPVQDIFEDDIFASEAVKLPVKAKELEPNLFDDDVDIFADLAEKPKEKSTKKKVEAKSIFDEDTDDIFSSSSQSKTSTRKAPSFQTASGTKSEFKASSNFEDPLNAFEGQ